MTPQIPLGSGFGPRTTARDVLGDRRLDRLHVVITGGSAGVGLETTRACAGAAVAAFASAWRAKKGPNS